MLLGPCICSSQLRDFAFLPLSHINHEKYKVVHSGEHMWVKEKHGDTGAIRHPVVTGPRGGQYFVPDDGQKRYVNNVSHHVHVYPQDVIPPPANDYGRYGNAAKNKK